ncbi:hypothetical protein C1N53_20520 [Pontibacter sp. SGAir0037]|nr:hypothetical protein C1N53_20520 [Pontibacter sp. SGAir0037]
MARNANKKLTVNILDIVPATYGFLFFNSALEQKTSMPHILAKNRAARLLRSFVGEAEFLG